MKQASQREGAQAPRGAPASETFLLWGCAGPLPSDDSLAFQTEFRTRERAPTVNAALPPTGWLYPHCERLNQHRDIYASGVA